MGADFSQYAEGTDCADACRGKGGRMKERTVLHDTKNEKAWMLRTLVEEGKVRMVLLSKEQFNLDATDAAHGNTALHIAAKQGNCILVGLLLRHGANVTKNKANQTPADLAKHGGHHYCFTVLQGAIERERTMQAANIQFKKHSSAIVVSKKQGVVSVLQKVKGLMHMGGPEWVEQYAAAEGKHMKLFGSEREMRGGGAPGNVLTLTNANVWSKKDTLPREAHFEFFLQQAHEGAPLALSCSDANARTAWIHLLKLLGAKVRSAADMEAQKNDAAHGGVEADATALDKGEHVVAMFAYLPVNLFSPFPPDPNMELTLHPGEDLELMLTVAVNQLEINDEGYCLCLRHTNGQKGWAPGNHLTAEVTRFKETGKGKPLMAKKETSHYSHHHVSRSSHLHHTPGANGTNSHSSHANVASFKGQK